MPAVDPDVAAPVAAAAGRLRGAGRGRRGNDAAVRTRRPRADPVLLGRAPPALRPLPARVGGQDGSGPGRLHPRRRGVHRGGVRRHAPEEARLRCLGAPLVRRLGPAADARGVGGRVPRRPAPAGALAAARLGLDGLGRVLVPLQLRRQSGGQRALRVHEGRSPGGPSGGRQALRRPDRPCARPPPSRPPGRGRTSGLRSPESPARNGLPGAGVRTAPGRSPTAGSGATRRDRDRTASRPRRRVRGPPGARRRPSGSRRTPGLSRSGPPRSSPSTRP